MRIFLMLALLVGMISIDPIAVHGTDEQRRAYDKMVEESVQEADDYVHQKQRQAAERAAEQKRAEKQRAEETAKMQETKEEEQYNRGVIVTTPPIGKPPGMRPPGRPPGGGPRPTPMPSGT
jgi:hypothetical protein